MATKMLTAGSALRVVKLDELQVDTSYQRDVRGKHKKIVTNFDKNALGIPLVGQREDGSLWIVDGLQRITALRKLEKKDVRVEVFLSKGPEHEADIFAKVNKNRTALSSIELFRAKLTAGDETAWAIKKCVESLGLLICVTRNRNGRPSDWKVISAIVAMERIVASQGIESLYQTLSIIKEAWSEDKQAMSVDIIAGLGEFLRRRNGVIDQDRFVAQLATTSPSKTLYSASLGIGSRTTNVADMFEKLARKRLTKK